MNNWTRVAGVSLLCLMAAGCTKNMDIDSALGIGGKAVAAATYTDADAQRDTEPLCKYMDENLQVAPANSKYMQRLNAIVKKLDVAEVNGAKTSYKVYITPEINAWAMANGCIRVYSGLMDMMNDDEVMGIVGHEIGHVALGHTRKAMQVELATSAAMGAAAAANSTVASLSRSELGKLTEDLINAQFSQSQESDSDDYSFDLLVKRKLSPQGLVTGFQKLAQLDGGKSSMLSSHPSSTNRASRLEARMKAELGTMTKEEVAKEEKKAPEQKKAAAAPAQKPAPKKTSKSAGK